MKFKPSRVIVYLIVRILCFVMYIFPLRFSVFLGSMLGRIAFIILRKERRIAFEQIEYFLSKTDLKDKSGNIAKKVFINLGKNVAEIVSLPKINERNISKIILEDKKSSEIFNNVLKQGKGAIILSAHIGNWELLAAYFSILGYPVNVIAREIYFKGYNDLY